MRLSFRLILTFVALAALGLAVWGYVGRDTLVRQWMCYRVGAAEDFGEARESIRWFEQGPDRQARLRELVGKWGTGNQQFDFYLAQYVGDPASSEALRGRFSLEFGWREELLTRWAHYWAWRARQEPDEQIASILAYLDTLASVEPPRPITWREVLDLQAILQLTGYTELARRLKPANWSERYARWIEQRPADLPHVARPALPFPDWQGPGP
jgi:hypothetical protein